MRNASKLRGISLAFCALVTILGAACDIYYTVTFDPNGGSGTTPPAQTVKTGSDIILPNGSGLTRSGYIFDCWNTQADGEGTNHSADSSATVEKDIILYAYWIIVPEGSFTVTFDSSGGSSVDMEIVQSGGTAARPADPIRNNYTFDNWYSDAGLTTVYNFSTPVSGNIILYAKWVYTVTFSINGGNGEVPAAQTVNTGSSITLPNGSGLTRSGYIFDCWNTNDSGTGTNYTAGASYTPAAAITLYARWIEVVVITAGVEMVYVDGGSFQMGNPDSSIAYSDNERPVHTVTLTGFYMGKYEVTQAQWQVVMGTTIQQLQTADGYGSTDYGRGDAYPVYCVSWYDALVFCNKLSIAKGLTPAYRIKNSIDPSAWGSVPATYWDAAWDTAAIVSGSTGYRLPAEAQWEYAAKGGNGSPGNYTYAGSNTVDEVAWYSGNSGSGTHEVGTKAANGLGIYDMSGNVWEWCWDWYGSYSNTAKTDPTGAFSGSLRVLRGGSWGISAESVRSAFRRDYDPFYRNIYGGFRLSAPPSEALRSGVE